MEQSPDFEKMIAAFSDETQALSRQTRNLIYSILPEVVEVVWIKQQNTGFGTGIKKKTEHFCWLMPATKHVTLGFNYGAELPDPKKMLEGNGKLFRHIKIKTAEDLSNPDLHHLIRFATRWRVPESKTKTKYEPNKNCTTF